MNPKGAPEAAGPGDFMLSKDGKTKYQIQRDGSWRKVADQLPGEFQKAVKEQVEELFGGKL